MKEVNHPHLVRVISVTLLFVTFLSLIFTMGLSNALDFSNFNGTFNNTIMNSTGSYVHLNFTDSTNTTYVSYGTYTSNVMDAGSTVIWDNLSWVEDFPCKVDIGRVGEDNNLASYEDGFINTTGLIYLMHFNNKSGVENNSFFYDFSPEVNNEENNYNNASCRLDLDDCPSYNYSDKKFGTASIYFDGVDDFVDLEKPSKDIINNNETWTISLWVKKLGSLSLSQEQRILVLRRGVTGSAIIVRYDVTNFLDMRYHHGSNFRTLLIGSLTDLGNDWHHVAITYDNKSMRTYLNGEPRENRTETFSGFGLGLAGLGKNIDANNYFLNGAVDELAIWNRTLSQNEIFNLYKRGILDIKFQVRSCNDELCDDETFVGSDNTSTSYFTNSNYSSFNLPNNRYFQYKTYFSTENESYTPGLYNVTIGYNSNTTLFISPITNLRSASNDTNWIYWNWTNPTYPEFSEAIVYLDGSWKTNTSNNFYNATGLNPNTSYTITVHTKYDTGDVNYTDVNNTASTKSLGDTNFTYLFSNTFLGWFGYVNDNLDNVHYANNKMQLEQNYAEGTYTSDVFDVQATASWDNLSWLEDYPCKVEMGGTSRDRNTASYENGFINTTGLILLMHFNKKSGLESNSFFYDFSPEINNEENNYNNATCKPELHDCPSYNFNEKKFGEASIHFDGFDDYVEFKKPSNEIINNNKTWTISLWVKKLGSLSLSQEQRIFVLRRGVTGSAIIIRYDITNFLDMRYYHSTDFRTLLIGNLSDLGNDWHHVAITYDNTSFRTYLNGEPRQNKSEIFSGFGSGAAGLGKNIDANNYFLNGAIDELAIWNRTLSQNEIFNLYKRGILDIKFQVRSCNDELCDDETFVGSDNTSTSYFTNSNYSSFNLPDNRYFQYKTYFSTENESYKPGLFNVSIGYTELDETPPVVVSNFPDTGFNTTSESINFSWTVNDDFDNSLICSIIINGSVNVSNIVVLNGTQKNYTINGFADGTHSWNVSCVDDAGNINYSNVRAFNVDSTPPSFTDVAIKTLLFISQVNSFLMQASDFLGVDSCWANITLPDLSVQTVNDLCNTPAKEFSSTSQLGTYIINYFINDTIGNKKITNNSFEIKPKVEFKFEFNVTNETNQVNVTIFKEGEDEVIYSNDTEGEIEAVLPESLLDFEFKSFEDNFKTRLKSINLTTEANKTIKMDKHTEEQEYLVTYAVNNTFNFTNATVIIYYDDLSFSNELNLQLHKCDDYNFTARSCLSGWYHLYSGITRNTSEDYFEYITTSFSGFSVKEYIPPATDSSDGGGSGGRPSRGGGLAFSWECGEWSECIDGLQSRECIRKGIAGIGPSTQVVKRKCTSIDETNLSQEEEKERKLFDITLIVDEELNQKEDILNAVLLLENFESEPLTINLDYTVYNNEGEQIFQKKEDVTFENMLWKEYSSLENLEEGKYKVLIKVIHNDTIETIVKEIEIGKKKGFFTKELIEGYPFINWINVIGILIILFISSAYLYFGNKYKKEVKNKEE